MIQVTFLISTWNRRDVLLATLAKVLEAAPDDGLFEIIVVDNGSRDGSAAAIKHQFPSVHLVELTSNVGSCAKNVGLDRARGEYVVFLDDDSYPRRGSIDRMIRCFEKDPKLGAATFVVTLPNGNCECSAYPDVFIGCGVGFRRSALEQVGGLPMDFFMQAEEYDLSLRLLNACWRVRRFNSLHVTHLKSPAARIERRTMRLDVRNNLALIARRFPDRWLVPFALDWMWRYHRIAAVKGNRSAFWLGLVQGLLRATRMDLREPISDDAFERFSRMAELAAAMKVARRRHSIRRCLFIDAGKNIQAYWRAAAESGIEILAIADPQLAGGRYRGIPVVSDVEAASLDFDAAIVSNLSPVHAANRRAAWRNLTSRPVLDLLDDCGTISGEAGLAPGSCQTAARIASQAA
jgi:GT2 family glycosyltransferase